MFPTDCRDQARDTEAEVDASPRAGAAGLEVVVPVICEKAALATREIETGRVRVRKSIEQREEVLHRTLFHDEVEVRHVPVNRVVDPHAPPVTREVDGVLIVPVLEEVLVVEKRLLLKEELHIERRRRETGHTQRVVLQSEKVMVERDRDGTSEDQR